MVLRRWLFNEGWQESFLHPHDPLPNNPFLHPPKAQTFTWDKSDGPTAGEPNNWLARVWASASEEALKDGFENAYWKENWQNNLTFSRDTLNWEAFGCDGPRRFVVENFSNPGWNFLDESVAEFVRRTELSFREHLATEEKLRLAWLNQTVAALGHRISAKEFKSESVWRTRQLNHLSRCLRAYTNQMERVRANAIAACKAGKKIYEHLTRMSRICTPRLGDTGG